MIFQDKDLLLMRNYGHTLKLKRLLRGEYDNLPPELRRPTNKINRRRRSITQIISGQIQKRKVVGRNFLKRRVIGDANSVSDFLINDFVAPPPPRKPRRNRTRSRPKRVVGR